MPGQEWLAETFQAHRARLRALCFRMLGSMAEADDAVQETWLRLSRSQSGDIGNLGGWLTTVAARICLDMLRTRSARREEPLDSALSTSDDEPRRLTDPEDLTGPEDEAITADAIGLALLVVLDRLSPAERVAFVLHDLFGIPFADIAPVAGCTPVAAKKLASRARAKVRGGQASDTDLPRRWRLVEAFLTATRDGDMQALLTLLDPDVVRRADQRAIPASAPAELHGADAVARGILLYARTARFARPALINGNPGLIVAPNGPVRIAITFSVRGNKIAEIDVTAEPASLAGLSIALPAGYRTEPVFHQGLAGQGWAVMW